jgi:hypothetical protein
MCLSGSTCVERVALNLRARDSQYVRRQRCCVNGPETPTFTVDPRVGERSVNDRTTGRTQGSISALLTVPQSGATSERFVGTAACVIVGAVMSAQGGR